MRIRVDPATDLPGSIVHVDEDGDRHTVSFDYPEQGPADIYDLGVPRTAKVIERFLPGDVATVVAALKTERLRFDDYCQYVVEERLKPTNYLPMTMVYRIWRKGPKWRIEELRPVSLEWAPPKEADLKWWKAHQADYEFIPRAICTGHEYWDYYFATSWKPGEPVPKPGKQTSAGTVVGPNALLGPSDDPTLPFWTQNLLVEQAGHPTAGVGEQDDEREFLVDAKPADWPPGTLLFRVRDTKATDPATPDHFRMWLNPQASHLAMRTEIRVMEPLTKGRYPTYKFAWLDTHIIEAFDKSPTGHAYPTRTRHIAYKGDHELVRNHFVDFTAEIKDELFEPLK